MKKRLNNEYQFPATKFARQNTARQQIAHLVSEAHEIIEAHQRWQQNPSAQNYAHLLDETTDLVISRETLRRIVPADMRAAEQRVLTRLVTRGYV